jgi:hypothetical protein
LCQAFRQAEHYEALIPDFMSVKAWAYTEIAAPNLSQSLQIWEFVSETRREHYRPCRDRYIRNKDIKQSI